MDNNFNKFNEATEILKVLAHPVRLCIVRGLIEKGNCNVSHMQDCLQTPQSTISQHLQKLRSAGIVSGSRNGVEIQYSICDERVKNIVTAIIKSMDIQ
jgi:DNA-binding transcriptional ArsR family regulator